ncbi:MAG: c-type cytochrome biogenesis protein CcmI [Chromatiales bacterium]
MLVAAAMVAATVAVVAVPLLRSRSDAAVDRTRSNLALLRDQLADLDADLARGVLSPEHYRDAREDLERRVLDEANRDTGTSTIAARGSLWMAAILAALIPAVAVLLYVGVGNPGALVAKVQAPAGGAREVSTEQLEQLVSELAARLERKPDDVEGWEILARSYRAMRRFDDAAKAYERAVRLAPSDPNLLAGYADVLAMRQEGRLSGRPIELIERALAIDPDHLKTLALAGREAFDRQDYTAAIGYWEQLRTRTPPDSSVVPAIEAGIAAARARIGNAGNVTTPAAPARVSGVITLSPDLTARAAPGDTVYVFARAVGGPPLPLAVLRKQVKDLPLLFTLNDTMAMTPDMKLSRFAEVVVGARVSKSGAATPQSGDLQGISTPVKVGASDVAVVVNRVLP